MTSSEYQELADLFVKLVDERQVDEPARYHAFIDVLRQDAARALAEAAPEDDDMGEARGHRDP